MKINIFWGDLTDISDKKEALASMPLNPSCEAWTSLVIQHYPVIYLVFSDYYFNNTTENLQRIGSNESSFDRRMVAFWCGQG